jgi:hypothetical protein
MVTQEAENTKPASILCDLGFPHHTFKSMLRRARLLNYWALSQLIVTDSQSVVPELAGLPSAGMC